MATTWKDRSGSWVPLEDLKESHPVEVAEFARARGINDEPAFDMMGADNDESGDTV